MIRVVRIALLAAAFLLSGAAGDNTLQEDIDPEEYHRAVLFATKGLRNITRESDYDPTRFDSTNPGHAAIDAVLQWFNVLIRS